MTSVLHPYAALKSSDVHWLCHVPEHWHVRRLRTVAEMRVSNVDKHTKEEEFPVRLCNYVDVYKNDRITQGIAFMSATASRDEIEKFRLNRNDVVITKDSEAWDDIGVPSLVTEPADDLISGYHLAVIRPKENTYGPYLFWALRSKPTAYQFHVEAKGVTRYGLAHHGIQSALIPHPPLSEQKAIVRFLDHAEEQIQRYIAGKERLIALLEEERQALVHQAVTRGLDPNVRLKSSGVEWIGDVPEHWEVRRVKTLSKVKRGSSPRPIDDPKYFDLTGEYAWVRIADVTASNHYLEETTQKLSALGQSLSVRLEPGSLFLSIAGSVGKPIITRIKCCIHDGFVYFPDLKDNEEYFYQILSTPSPFFGLGKYGTQLNLNTDTVGGIQVAWPPLWQRNHITEFLHAASLKFDEGVAGIRNQIDLMNEYRTRLIADVVTGQLDVRKAAAQLPAAP